MNIHGDVDYEMYVLYIQCITYLWHHVHKIYFYFASLINTSFHFFIYRLSYKLNIKSWDFILQLSEPRK